MIIGVNFLNEIWERKILGEVNCFQNAATTAVEVCDSKRTKHDFAIYRYWREDDPRDEHPLSFRSSISAIPDHNHKTLSPMS